MWLIVAFLALAAACTRPAPSPAPALAASAAGTRSICLQGTPDHCLFWMNYDYYLQRQAAGEVK